MTRGDSPRARAAAFLDDQGDPVLSALVRVLEEQAPPASVAEAMARARERDPSVADVLAALQLLDVIGVSMHPVAADLCRALVARQRDDGSWGDTDDAEARIGPTGAVGAALARTPHVRSSVLAAAEAWMAARWSVERVQGGGQAAYDAILAYFSLLANVPSELADEATQWCGRELERGFRTGAFDPVATARVFLRCGAQALPGARLRAEEVLDALASAQAPDGGFGVLDALPAERVRDTLDAFVALSRLEAAETSRGPA